MPSRSRWRKASSAASIRRRRLPQPMPETGAFCRGRLAAGRSSTGRPAQQPLTAPGASASRGQTDAHHAGLAGSGFCSAEDRAGTPANGRVGDVAARSTRWSASAGAEIAANGPASARSNHHQHAQSKEADPGRQPSSPELPPAGQTGEFDLERQRSGEHGHRYAAQRAPRTDQRGRNGGG